MLLCLAAAVLIAAAGCGQEVETPTAAQEAPDSLQVTVGEAIRGLYTVHFKHELVGYLDVRDDYMYSFEPCGDLSTPPEGIESLFCWQYPEGGYAIRYCESVNENTLLTEVDHFATFPCPRLAFLSAGAPTVEVLPTGDLASVVLPITDLAFVFDEEENEVYFTPWFNALVYWHISKKVEPGG
jgi:hypothetical protein